MGKDKKKQQQQVTQQMQNVGETARQQYERTMGGPSAMETEMAPISQNYADLFNLSAGRNMQDYADMMGGYQRFAQGLGGPTKFGFERVKAERPAELGESYGYLRETMPGYRDFANTGGYSAKDIQELRARSTSPVRAAYGNTMMQLDRSRALGGAGGAPNYIAAASRAQREMPGQLADAMTNINAQLAQDIRQGKLAGLAGMAGVGGTMGGLSSAEAGRMLQAAQANQAADLQAQQLSEASLQNLRQSQLAALSGQAGLYGTTPGMASMFGNQALNAYQMRAGMDQARNQFGLGLLNAQLQAAGAQHQALPPPGTPWWQTAANIGMTALPYVASYYGGRGGGKPIQPTVTEMGGNIVYPS